MNRVKTEVLTLIKLTIQDHPHHTGTDQTVHIINYIELELRVQNGGRIVEMHRSFINNYMHTIHDSNIHAL